MTASLPATLAALVERGARLLEPPTAAMLGLRAAPVIELCAGALETPRGLPTLEALTCPSSRVVVLVSDATRDEPREAMIEALCRAMPRVSAARITLVIASGTHAPRSPRGVLSPERLARHPVVVHDGLDEASMTDLGATPSGTRVRVNSTLARADLVISTGRIRPHYFAGFSGGAKSIFPGCALSVDARQNHLFKALPTARLGRLDDNVCRLDMEDAARRLPCPTYLLNVVADRDGVYTAAAAGDLVEAHREACEGAAPLFLAEGPASRVVVTSDLPPVTSSLYQASKLLPPAGPLLEEGGLAVVVAACEEGIGPLETVNRGIYELGVRHHLPARHELRLVSSMDPAEATRGYAPPSASVEQALAERGYGPRSRLEGVTVLWRAGELIASREELSAG